MDFPRSFFGFRLRPVVLCAAGISAAAVMSSFLLYRWRVPDQQRRGDAATQTDDGDHRLLHTAGATDGVDHHQDAGSSVPQIWQEVPFIPPTLCGPLARIQELRQELDRNDKFFAYTYENWCSDGLKLVEVKLQHKSLYNGLESEHWWVLNNNFYNVSTQELPPQYFACASAVACIKRIGASISEVKVYLRTESSHTSVQNVTLQTRVSRVNKCVFIDSDGHFWSHESSNTHILETPAPFVCPARPRGPPPGF
ncbi:uncharacterized protein LOC108425131 [Pygocentrus nattereri]|uniref:uncharacterized protein LOC108425131 n=1 Tax=Pygocentrus nattereri TaxID=42514 RepID=UPI00189168C9|nr:uncharacterized protein LOC108425131 [Pygocentrus nattereri]